MPYFLVNKEKPDISKTSTVFSVPYFFHICSSICLRYLIPVSCEKVSRSSWNWVSFMSMFLLYRRGEPFFSSLQLFNFKIFPVMMSILFFLKYCNTSYPCGIYVALHKRKMNTTRVRCLAVLNFIRRNTTLIKRNRRKHFRLQNPMIIFCALPLCRIHTRSIN